ncbi:MULTISPECIES: DUF2461 domain-containing protein [unclassified Rhodococcus (in: high G+C Gram-positive bacteria)]|jgi:uncharacterized protein (TIGR02453 family)|uniref:DUF2461 domain-containing protein n=1 Tax=unclassified Rhodococcus (in: high G+C Gram-positive bacteria) TaxID=192944 RepID=UPI001C9B4601|nr:MULTISPECIES: DUF2461 domain-containing protein [unclassified Rhodococcus (in: high G+C Gram-positive bacteria)]MBY6679033.1 DUF2461 domain-containing protein [Rhodococcus sp. BP-332]MBY6683364.1 DUF2461 domain-containing protein [Rhodococcus sp. BP-316]MBY6685439.1 DUF2461 domain-containing protein [Rhodococcus sp. BP-288]MBY6696557.1 DUF2461 domain-containing protein [Rhodococcus sp. BP-188]MBY6696859.1 DUF2461 domain-containing protein [Rhodococcus sp. BP-285]
MSSFTGIPEAALDFYEDLEVDNSKTWWAEHKHVYDESVRAPMTALTEVLAEEFGTAKLFRPHRDVRFSKDKVPYKTHQGAYVQVAPSTGWYVQVDASGLMVAGGFYASTSDSIAQFRAVVDDEVRGSELARIVADLESRGYDRGGDRLKTSPRGYDADHPRIDLLRHKSLTAGRSFGCPPWLDTAECADHIRGAWRDLTPLLEWCRQVLA